jgi:hypothetical protein
MGKEVQRSGRWQLSLFPEAGELAGRSGGWVARWVMERLIRSGRSILIGRCRRQLDALRSRSVATALRTD